MAVSGKEGCGLFQLRLCQGLRSDRFGGGGYYHPPGFFCPNLALVSSLLFSGCKTLGNFSLGGSGCFLSKPNGRPSQGCRETERQEASLRPLCVHAQPCALQHPFNSWRPQLCLCVLLVLVPSQAENRWSLAAPGVPACFLGFSQGSRCWRPLDGMWRAVGLHRQARQQKEIPPGISSQMK